MAPLLTNREMHVKLWKTFHKPVFRPRTLPHKEENLIRPYLSPNTFLRLYAELQSFRIRASCAAIYMGGPPVPIQDDPIALY